MTPQESAMLNSLVRKVQQTQLTEKDPEAESLLSQSLGRDPDALYKLAQTVLVQNIALDQARAQMEQFKQQQAQPAHTTSFLGGLLGHREQTAPAPPPQPAYSAPSYAQPYSVAAPSSGGSFLRSAATTAAGVAAGALAFEGVESMLHGFGHGGMGYGGYGMGGMPVEENVVNNYYDTPAPSMDEHHEHEASFDDRPDSGNASQPTLDDASYDPSGDGSDMDSSDLDDSSFKDDGSDFGGDDINFA